MAYRDTDYANLRNNLAAQYAEMSDERIEEAFARAGMDAEAMEGFFDDLGKFAANTGKTLLKAAPSILPTVGTIAGTAFGGPLGAQIGGTLGSLAGNALGAASTGGGSAAAGQLLQTIAKPETLQDLGFHGDGRTRKERYLGRWRFGSCWRVRDAFEVAHRSGGNRVCRSHGRR